MILIGHSSLCYFMEMKQCRKCKEVKSDDEFRKQPQNRDGLQSYCAACQNLGKSDWARRNPKHYLEYQRRKYRENRKRGQDRNRKYKWGLSPEEFGQMLSGQDNKCSICRRDQSEIRRSFDIDHDHLTGKIRSLLCNRCNITLGRCEESVEIFESIISYLKKHQ